MLTVNEFFYILLIIQLIISTLSSFLSVISYFLINVRVNI